MKNIHSIFVIILTFLLFIQLFTSCTGRMAKGEQFYILNGKFITATVSCDGGEHSEKLTDNSGMSGLDASNHLHSSNSRDMFLQTGAEPMIFTFEEPVALGNMYIWNYNAEGYLNCGIKDAKIEYSFDGQSWAPLGEDGLFTFARALESENSAYGGNSANNTVSDRSPVSFNGIVAKYVRITPISNYGVASDGYGLSEVRFFRHKIRPNNGDLLPAISISPLADNITGYGENIASGAALTQIETEITAGNDASRMWCVSSLEEAMAIIDLDGTYPVSSLTFWNYNDADALDSGIQELKIEYTVADPYTSNTDGSINYDGGTWELLGTYTLQRADGGSRLPPSLYIDLGNRSIHAQHLRITAISNYGGPGYGLAGMTVSCGSGWAVEPARQWTGLFSSVGSYPYQASGTGGAIGNGWLGADGIYSLNLNSGDMMGSVKSSDNTLFVFSDTLIGNFNNYAGTPGMYSIGMSNRSMVNHSFALLKGDVPDPRNLQFYMHTSSGQGNIIPYQDWVQELVKIGDNVFCFGMRYGSDWSAQSWDLVKFPFLSGTSSVDFSQSPSVTQNFNIEADVDGISYDFSAAVLNNTESGGATPSPDGYIYIYGLKCVFLSKHAIIARVNPEDFEDASKWTYWDGSQWTSIIENCAEISSEGVVSSEYSVSYMTDGPFAGKYAMNFTRGSIGTCLQIAWSDSLTGIFDNFTTIYCCDEAYDYPAINGDTGIYTYNSKAHPNLSADGELLISYNLNSFNFDSNLSHQYLHPHFVTYFEIG